MGLFNTDYSKPGPGISKNEPKRKGLGRYYQLIIRKFWDLIKLNFLYILVLLPTFAVVFVLSGMISNRLGIDAKALSELAEGSLLEAAKVSVTADILIRFYTAALFSVLWGGGPATAGFVYILRSFINEEPVFMTSDFFARIKSNFRQSLAVWVIDLVVFTLLCYAYFFYGSLPGILFYGKYVVLVIALFYTMLHLYIYHLLVTYKLTLFRLFKSSALFALSALPFSVLTILFTSFLMLIWPMIGFTARNGGIAVFFMTASIFLTATLLFSVCGLYVEFNAVTQVRKYIKEDADVEIKI